MKEEFNLGKREKNGDTTCDGTWYFFLLEATLIGYRQDSLVAINKLKVDIWYRLRASLYLCCGNGERLMNCLQIKRDKYVCNEPALFSTVFFLSAIKKFKYLMSGDGGKTEIM